MLVHQLVSTLHTTVVEAGMNPGKGLTAIQTALIYFVAPVAIFGVIVAISYALTGDRKSKSTSLTFIE